ncbi:DPCD protein family [Popillia japonica]|uniref:Protein DPCD n=1 Tax=Popillia japonica TaxID=7064 RepID=A0AAW1MCF7_POPJA
MVEEYNMDTGVLTRRAWRRQTNMGGEGDWDIEIGDPEPTRLQKEICVIKEDSNQPFITRRITKNILEWRIRNLPYPLDVYSVTADSENRCLIVRTTNKKYYKKLTIPELDRVNLVPQQDAIQFTHKYNTLIITYKKPKEVVLQEKIIFEEIVKKVEAKPGDKINDCKVS